MINGFSYDEIFSQIEEFENDLAASNLEFQSPCGRILVICDGLGDPIDIELSDDIPGKMTVEEVELLFLELFSVAKQYVSEKRDEFYGNLVIGNETLARWQKHPPAEGTTEAFFISAINSIQNFARNKAKLMRENND